MRSACARPQPWPPGRAGRGGVRPRHGGDHVRGEVDDLLQVLRRDIQQVAQPARNTLEVPDVRDRRGQLNVAHALATHVGARHLHATAFTDDALEAHPLVLTAVALPVPGRTKDLLAEQPVTLRLERAVVDRLRLLDFAVAPLADLIRGGQADAQLVVSVDVQHVTSFSPLHLGIAVRIGGRRPGRQDRPGPRSAGSELPEGGRAEWVTRRDRQKNQTSSMSANESAPGRRDRSIPNSSARW